MRLEPRLTIAAPGEYAWPVLLEMVEHASSLPEAQLTKVDGELVWAGEVTIQGGGSPVRCRATLRPVDTDDDDRVVTLRLHGREIAGPARGDGMLRGRLISSNGSTQLELSAEISIAGARASTSECEHAAHETLGALGRTLVQRAETGAATGGQADSVDRHPQTRKTRADAPITAPREGLSSRRAASLALAAAAVIAAAAVGRSRRPRSGSVTLTWKW